MGIAQTTHVNPYDPMLHRSLAKKTIQSTLRSNIIGHMCCPCEHFPLQRTIQSTLRGNILGHICGPREHFVLLFLQGKVLAWPTHMTQYVALRCTLYCFFCKGKCSHGANKYDQICCRTWSTWRIWRTRRAWHAWAPASRTWGRIWFPIAAHPKTAAEHAEARVLLMCWEGGWE